MENLRYIEQTFLVSMIIGYLLPTIQVEKNNNINKQEYRCFSAFLTSCFICERIVIYIYYLIQKKKIYL